MYRTALFAAALVATILSAPVARGQTSTWTGAIGTDWNTAGNWNPSGVPNNGQVPINANFAGAGLGTVNISASVQVNTLSFSNAAGNYTLTSSAGQTLTLPNLLVPGNNNPYYTPTISVGNAGTATINLANVSGGSLLYSAELNIYNNSTAAGTSLVIGPNTVIGSISTTDVNDFNDVYHPGGMYVFGGGNTVISGSFSAANPVLGLVTYGPGTLTLSGSGAGLTNDLSLYGGNLVLDYSTNTASKLASGSLYLNGGLLQITPNLSTPITQVISAGTLIDGFHTDVQANGNGTLTLNAGAITRTAGATADFFTTGVSGSGFNVATSTTTPNGLLGSGPAFATFRNGSTWATVSGGIIAGLSNFGNDTYTPNTNVNVTTSASESNITVNSLMFANGSATTLTLGGTNTIQSGGILAPPAATPTITGGTLTAPGGGELIVHAYGVLGPLTINSALVSSVGLTKTGPGTLILTGNNTGLTGPININRGSLMVTNLAAINFASMIDFNDDRASSGLGGGLQTFTVDLGNNTTGTVVPPVVVSAFSPNGGGTVFSTGGSVNSRVTLSEFEIYVAHPTTSVQFTGDSSDTSGFNVVAGLPGTTTLSHGFLGLGANTVSAPMVLEVNDAVAGGVELLTNGSTVTGPVTISGTTRIVCDGLNQNSITGTVSSPGSGSGFQFVKAGTGTLIFSGDGSGQLGGLTLSGGTLVLDFSTNTASKLGGGALTLGGGVLALKANASTTAGQLIPGGTLVAAGQTDVQAVASSAFLSLNLGAITRNVGATIDIGEAPNFFVITSATTTNGLLGSGPAFATAGGGSTWAAVNISGFVGGYGGYGTDTYTPGTNVDVTVSATQSSFTANSLRFNTGNLMLMLSGTNTLQSGGILVTPNAAGGTITGGTLTVPGSGELLVHQYGAGNFTINSALVSTAGLTKTGPGTLILGGNNTGLTGPINVNRGNLTATILAAVASASQINFNDDRAAATIGAGLQQFTVDLGNGVNGTINSAIRLSAANVGDYGTYFSTGGSTGSTITLGGVITTTPGLTSSVRFTGDASNSSGFNLTNTNTFTGNLSLLQGSLGINADASLGNATNVLALEVNSVAAGGLVFLNGGVTVARPVMINSPTRLVSNGTDSNTISGLITSSVGLIKDGAGTLTLTNPDNTIAGEVTVSLGTLVAGAIGVLPSGVSVTAAAGGTFTPFTAASATFGTLTLNGGAFRVPGGTGQQYTVMQILTNSTGGTVDFTGAGADQLLLPAGAAVTINGNSTWLSPGNGTTVVNATGAAFPISVAPGVTFTNGIALASTSAFGFLVTGGGTLFQNSDSTNVLGMTAPVTVAQGSTFRVTDASSNGGVGNFGTGAFTLYGGTFDYGGVTATTAKPIGLTASGGAIQVESAGTTLTSGGAITGPGNLTKTGPGTLVLANAGNSFGSLTVNAGTLQTANDNTLGPNPVITVNAAGTLNYVGNTATSRTFSLNFGTLAVSGGFTTVLNGAAVNGGFVHGPGTFAVTGGTTLSGVTTSVNADISQTGSASFANVTNGGLLNIAAGLTTPASLSSFTNQGSGSVTAAASSQVNATDFQTYGTLTLSPGTGAMPTQLTNTGSTPLFFNGGSRTFISIPGHTGDFDAGIDLHGDNAVVAGGLFVNNGYVVDSVGAGTKTVIADFGSLVKGAGFYQNSVQTVNGGKFQSGNSPGKASFGSFIFGPGGVSNYVWAIDDATGTAGPSPDASGQVSGWGLVKTIQRLVGGTTTTGDFAWTATPANQLTVSLETLVNPTTVGTDIAGPMSDFDPTKPYAWLAASWAGNYTGPTDPAALNASTAFDTSGFANPVAGTFGWSLDQTDHTLSLTYTPSAVPEPGTLALLGAATAGLALRRRQWHRRAIVCHIRIRRGIIGVAVALAIAPAARGQLDPNAFTTLGSLNVSSGTLTINTDTLSMSGAASFLGVSFNQNNGPQVAVFDFSSINIGSGVTVNLTGSRRTLALLSQGNATIQTTLTVSTFAGSNVPTLGGYPGGSASVTSDGNTVGLTQNGGGPGGGAASLNLAEVAGFAGGGGYGGYGGYGGPGGLQGQAYGNLFQSLQGGSAGGAAVIALGSSGPFGSNIGSGTAEGGAGGGALEVVASGTLAVATVTAQGSGGTASAVGNNTTSEGFAQAGGGAGGGILLSGRAGLTLNGSLDAHGGDSQVAGGGAGGGGGGQIALSGLSSYTLGTNTFAFNLNGGNGTAGGTAGFAGVLTVDALSTTIPSGTSVTLNGTPVTSVAGSTTQTGPTIEAYIRNDLIVNNGATVTLGMNNALQHLDAAGFNITSLSVGGFLNLNGFSQTVHTITNTTGAAGFIFLPAGSTLTVSGIGSNGGGGNYPGQLAGSGSFVLDAGAGSLLMAAASPLFTGQTTVTSGSLTIGAQTLQNSTVVLAGGSLGFVSGTADAVLGALGGTGTFSLAGSGFNSLTLAGNGASTIFGGNVSGSVPGGLIKAGTGTWTLTGTNTQSGPFNVQAGTVLIGSPGALAPGNSISVSAGATLDLNGYGYTVTSGNALTVQGNLRLGGAGVTVASGATATYNGGFISNGFLSGSGTHTVTGGAALSGITTLNSTVISQTGAGTFTNFTNGGVLTVAGGLSAGVTLNGFTNQGSGAITVGAGSQVSAANFETYGALALNPGSTAVPTQVTNAGGSNLFFNGGSRTFISIPSHAGQFDAGIDLHGNSAVVAGGLFVNNGYVVDSTNSMPPVTVIADFGSLVKGAGFYQNSVQTVNGGKFQSGNSPGKASFGSFIFGPGGVSNYIFAIDDATGTAGPSPDANGQVRGWGLVKTVQRLVGSTTTTGEFAWTATAANKLTVSLDTLINPTTVGADVAGPMADFDPTRPYAWLAASWAGNYTGPTDPAALDSATVFDTSGFQNPTEGTFGWSLDAGGHSLSLTYTPSAVPEPGTLGLAGIAAVALAWRRARQDGTSRRLY